MNPEARCEEACVSPPIAGSAVEESCACAARVGDGCGEGSASSRPSVDTAGVEARTAPDSFDARVRELVAAWALDVHGASRAQSTSEVGFAVPDALLDHALRAVVDAHRQDAAEQCGGTRYCTAISALLCAFADEPAFLAAHPHVRIIMCDAMDRVSADMAVLGAAVPYVAAMDAALNDVAMRNDYVMLNAEALEEW